MSGCITRCTRCRTPWRSTSRRGRMTRRSAPSWRSARTWRSGPGTRDLCSARCARTAPTAIRTGPRRAGRGRAAVRDGPQTAPRHLGPRPGRPHPVDSARALTWNGPGDPGDWHRVARTFRHGHAETWYAADARLGWWGPDGARRLMVATADPATLPAKGHLVPGHQPAPPRRPARGRQPAPGRRPGRDHADLRHPALDRAKVPSPGVAPCNAPLILAFAQLRG
jgi:hypothetical protein